MSTVVGGLGLIKHEPARGSATNVPASSGRARAATFKQVRAALTRELRPSDTANGGLNFLLSRGARRPVGVARS
eukprot:10287907-Lingulodinium_polyedra.AAC.1